MNIPICLFSAVCLLASRAVAADAGAPRGNAAFLFAYQPDDGQAQQFEAGYRQHLGWHREHRDPLPWFGWFVVSGERVGLFVDGSFGITFESFDNRVEPARDAADAARTFAPYGDTAYRKVLRLMPRLGTATPLEDRRPSPSVEVVTYVVDPGQSGVFESCLEALVASADDLPAFAVYRQLSGGEQPAYLVLFPREGFGYFEQNTPSLEALIVSRLEPEAGSELLARLAESVQRSHSETWAYRKDLSYFPEPAT